MMYLIQELKRNGFEPVICTHLNDQGGLRSKYFELEVKIYNLSRKHFFDLSILKKLKNVIEEEQIEIIVLFMPHNFVYYRLTKIFIRRRIYQIGLLRSMGFWLGHKNFLFQIIDNFLSTRFIKTSDMVLANSKAIKLQYDSRLKLPEQRIKVIYNSSEFVFSINRSPEEVRHELGIKKCELLVTMVARLDPWKDFDTFLSAAKTVRNQSENFKFVICGGGELQCKLESKIKNLGLESTVFLIGERKNVHEYINASDISVLTTRGEGFSNVIMESMALAKPVIASDVGGNSELIGRTNGCGFLIKNNDYSSLANIVLLLGNKREMMKEIGMRARARIFELCNKQKNMKLMIDEFKSLPVC